MIGKLTELKIFLRTLFTLLSAYFHLPLIGASSFTRFEVFGFCGSEQTVFVFLSFLGSLSLSLFEFFGLCVRIVRVHVEPIRCFSVSLWG